MAVISICIVGNAGASVLNKSLMVTASRTQVQALGEQGDDSVFRTKKQDSIQSTAGVQRSGLTHVT